MNFDYYFNFGANISIILIQNHFRDIFLLILTFLIFFNLSKIVVFNLYIFAYFLRIYFKMNYLFICYNHFTKAKSWRCGNKLFLGKILIAKCKAPGYSEAISN